MKNMARVLVLANKDLAHPEAGGGTMEMFRMLKLLVDGGHSVTVFSCSFPDSKKLERISGVDIVRFGGMISTMFLAPWYYLKMKNQFDIVLDVPLFGIPYFSPIYSRKPVISLCWHLPRETFSIEMERKWGIKGRIAGKLAAWVEDFWYPAFYKNITTYLESEATKLDLVSIGFNPEKLKVFPYALSRAMLSYSPEISTNLVRTYPKTSFPSIICLGRLRKYKGVHDLIRAAAIAKEKLPDLKVYIVGKGDYEFQLQELAKELGVLGTTVEFCGFVSVERKFELLGSSRAMVMPSYKEAFPTPVFEAYLCGTPSIVSDAVGVKEFVIDGKSGIVYQAGNHDILAQVIIKYFTDRSLELSLTNFVLANPGYYDDWVKGGNEAKMMEDLNNEIATITTQQ